jgi:hypothetical protein
MVFVASGFINYEVFLDNKFKKKIPKVYRKSESYYCSPDGRENPRLVFFLNETRFGMTAGKWLIKCASDLLQIILKPFSSE